MVDSRGDLRIEMERLGLMKGAKELPTDLSWHDTIRILTAFNHALSTQRLENMTDVEKLSITQDSVRFDNTRVVDAKAAEELREAAAMSVSLSQQSEALLDQSADLSRAIFSSTPESCTGKGIGNLKWGLKIGGVILNHGEFATGTWYVAGTRSGGRFVSATAELEIGVEARLRIGPLVFVGSGDAGVGGCVEFKATRWIEMQVCSPTAAPSFSSQRVPGVPLEVVAWGDFVNAGCLGSQTAVASDASKIDTTKLHLPTS